MQRFFQLLLFIFLFCALSQAQLTDAVKIHGFGGWAAGLTDNENNFVFAKEDLNLTEYNLSLNLTAKPADKVLINSQISFGKEERWRNSRDGYYKRTAPKVNIDYIFLHYSYSSLLNVRLGNVMSPIGLYSEIYDVGTLRPFYLLPVGMYKGPGMFPKSYLGAGLTGFYDISEEWAVLYDVISGEMYFNSFYYERPDPYPVFHKILFQPVGKYMSAVKLTLENSDLGLRIGGSFINFKAYTSIDEGPAELGTDSKYLKLYHGFIEYSNDELTVRSEIYQIPEGQENGSFYIEASYFFWDNFQAAFSYDTYENTTPAIVAATSFIPSSLSHQSMGFGLNYWFSSTIALKASYYIVNDNTHAAPDWYIDTVDETLHTQIKKTTNVLIFGTQFSF